MNSRRAGIVIVLVTSAALGVATVPAGGGVLPPFAITEVVVDPPAPAYPTDLTVIVRGVGAACSLVEVQLVPGLDDGDSVGPGEPVTVAAASEDEDGNWEGVLVHPSALPGNYWVLASCQGGPVDGSSDGRSDAVRVAPPTSFVMATAPHEAEAGVGGTIEVTGDGCVFPIVQVSLFRSDDPPLGFMSDQDLSSEPGGGWTTEIPFRATDEPGDYTVLARCGDNTGFGRHVYYAPQTFTVLAAPEPPPPPPQPDAPDFTG